MTSSHGNIFRVTGHLCGEFTGPRWVPAQKPVTRSFDVFFYLRPNIRLSKQWWGWWFETPSCPLWRHCNAFGFCVTTGLHNCFTKGLNILRLRQNGRSFADDTFKRTFLNENVIIAITISLKFVLKCQINNIPALVQIMAWRWPCDKLLTEPMMIILPTHICVTRPEWVNILFRRNDVPWGLFI